MFEVVRTAVFARWLSALRDTRAQAALQVRLERLSLGLFGDSKAVGEGVSELRIDVGAGYRAYYIRSGRTVVVMLCGGDKKTQPRDIERAKVMARELRAED
jgi:putative addiction module killer protein